MRTVECGFVHSHPNPGDRYGRLLARCHRRLGLGYSDLLGHEGGIPKYVLFEEQLTLPLRGPGEVEFERLARTGIV